MLAQNLIDLLLDPTINRSFLSKLNPEEFARLSQLIIESLYYVSRNKA